VKQIALSNMTNWLGQFGPFFPILLLQLTIRVTRLGEFSPIGLVFSLGSIFLNYGTSTKKLWAIIPTAIVMYYLSSPKNALGYILGDFFTNSSDHPADDAHRNQCRVHLCDLENRSIGRYRFIATDWIPGLPDGVFSNLKSKFG
jgi:hypothetical protein